MSGVHSFEIENKLNALFSEILLEQQKFNHLKGPEAGKEGLIKEKLLDYTQYRGKGFFFDYLSSGRGHGPFSEQIDGSIKYDLISGIGFNLVGHSHPLMIKSCLEAATVDSIMCGNLQTYTESNELGKALINYVPKSRLSHFWFSCSGSFANDIALKILWQKKAPSYKLIAFEKAFAGRTVATQDITDKPEFREDMPQLIDVRRVPHFDQKDPKNSLKKTLLALEKVWMEDPGGYCAIMLELIQGEAGFVYGPKEYYEGIFNWAREKNIYIWVDEVQTFGRTHELFAFQMLGLDNYVDIVTVGKALHSCGVLFTKELNPRPGLIAGTFNGSITSIKAGIKILKYLKEGNFYGGSGRIKEIETSFIEKLDSLKNGSCKGKIGYLGGVGSMISFEVGDSSTEIVTKFIKRLYENGVICFSAGKNPCRVRFLIPLSITEDHIGEIFTIIEKTILEVI